MFNVSLQPERVIPPINRNWTCMWEVFICAALPPIPRSLPLSPHKAALHRIWAIIYSCFRVNSRNAKYGFRVHTNRPPPPKNTTRQWISVCPDEREILYPPKTHDNVDIPVCIRNDIYKPCVGFRSRHVLMVGVGWWKFHDRRAYFLNLLYEIYLV